MYVAGKEYLYARRLLVRYISSTETHHLFKGQHQMILISLGNTKNIREPFKYIKA